MAFTSRVTTNNLKNIDVSIPIGLMTVVSGVSGSGKSSLVRDTLLPAVFNHLTRGAKQQEGQYSTIDGLNHIEQLVAIDQSLLAERRAQTLQPTQDCLRPFENCSVKPHKLDLKDLSLDALVLMYQGGDVKHAKVMA